ncbi:hypothetical protein [Cellulomonas phragmiteti]|uniref:Uncharacterized protein n=3 Tax=Cellulomonas TaxID=1707 RepID=A0ABQ4DRG4_9CELL|nr:hypothetical protein [Cellulomonas phragmiteti]GIG41941.1 hypothetical protein Cph01nite_37030 [Cellulomonas phragmiteti]
MHTTFDGALAVHVGGAVRCVPATDPGQPLTSYLDAALGGPDLLAGPIARQLLEVLAPRRAEGARTHSVLAGRPLVARLLHEWDPERATRCLAELDELAADPRDDMRRAPLVHVGPFAIVMVPSGTDEVHAMSASGPLGRSHTTIDTAHLLAANDTWLGDQGTATATAYARLRGTGLSARDALGTLPALLADPA